MGQPDHTVDSPLIGESSVIQELRVEIVRAARGRQPVLIQGATGTGKELVARALHAASRRPGRFVAVNVAAITETLFESELFGHVRGAFSGATNDRTGLVRSAERGTLFLDEIGELPLGLQAKLLRVLEEREVWPVGADTGQRVDLRVIAATNADLWDLVGRNQFRRDLLYRLLGTVLTLPLLCERTEDIPILAAHFLRIIAAEYNSPPVVLAPRAIDVLCAHAWPGNVRELRQVLEHALLRTDEPVMRDVHIVHALTSNARAIPVVHVDAAARERLLNALSVHHGDAQAVARTLGVSRATLYRHMRKFGISLQKQPAVAPPPDPEASL